MNHEYFMIMAFKLARFGLGYISPGPLVGAVVVRNNKILGTGHYQKYGSSSAEVNAILDAKTRGETVLGATLYCNLESGLDTLKKISLEGISQVVISTINPNPKVNGSGVEFLRSQGIEVLTGILCKDGLVLNEVFFKFSATNIPFIHLKLALSHDGQMVINNGGSEFIAGAESLKRVHDLRQKYDCVVVGRKTIELDNPSFTTSSDGFNETSQPLRIVLGKLQGLNHASKILTDKWKRNTMLVAIDDEVRSNSEEVRFLESQGVALLSVKKNAEGKVDLKSMLKSLASLKLTSILVESGPTLATEFIKSNLVDRVSFFMNPVHVGKGENASLDLEINALIKRLELKNKTTEQLGNDILIEGCTKN